MEMEGLQGEVDQKARTGEGDCPWPWRRQPHKAAPMRPQRRFPPPTDIKLCLPGTMGEAGSLGS